MIKKITSGIVDKAALGFLHAAAPPIFAPISEALSGFFSIFVANFLSRFSTSFSWKNKKMTQSYSFIVWILKTIDFFLFYICYNNQLTNYYQV